MKANIPTASQIVKLLSGVRPDGGWVVSCYLKLEPRDRSRGKYLIKLKNRIRQQEAWSEERQLPRAERAQISGDLAAIYDFASGSENLPAGRGIAIFACRPANIFEVVPLPMVYRSRLAVDRTPLVREVAAIGDQFGSLIAAAYDRTSARLFRLTAFGIEEVSDLTAGDTTRASRFHGARVAMGRGSVVGAHGEHNYHQRLKQERHRHYATVAESIFRLHRQQPATGIVLGATGSDGQALAPFLHSYLDDLVLGAVKLNPKTVTPPEVFAAAVEVRQQREREVERQYALRVTEQAPLGWAVNGVSPTLSALSVGQVRTLLVATDGALPGYRCSESGRLDAGDRPCRGEGHAVSVADVVDEAIEDALAQRAEINVIFDAEARRSIDSLAGVLRFRSA